MVAPRWDLKFHQVQHDFLAETYWGTPKTKEISCRDLGLGFGVYISKDVALGWPPRPF